MIVLWGRGRGILQGVREKTFALVIWLFYELGGGKCEVSYAYDGKCSSICDAICHRTGIAPGVVLWGRKRSTLEGMREKIGVGNMAFLRDRVWQIKSAICL